MVDGDVFAVGQKCDEEWCALNQKKLVKVSKRDI